MKIYHVIGKGFGLLESFSTKEKAEQYLTYKLSKGGNRIWIEESKLDPENKGHQNDNDDCPLNDPETFANPAIRGLSCTCPDNWDK